MNNQARIIALKLAAKILSDVGLDGMPLEGHMDLELLAERNKVEGDIGEEWESIIKKLNNAIVVLDGTASFLIGNDDVRLDV